MTNNDIEEIVYNEEKFNSIKKEMENVWMNDPINRTELDNNLSRFFINLYEDYSQNCLLIRLLQFQCQCNTIGSSFIVPFYHSRKFTNIDRIVNALKNSEDTQKLINFFKRCKNPLINYYFWNITFPNIFGSFFSQEFCEAAFTFLTKFKDDVHIFSKGVISFINHNYLFQNSFLNTFYTLLNRPYKNKEEPQFYGWCEYNQDRFDNIILIALIEASKQLNSHQIMALNMFIDKYQEEAEKLIFSDIIIDSLKNIWPYSSYFLPTEMISDVNEKYINNQQSFTNYQSLLQNFFKEVKSLTAKNEFKMSELVSMKESFIITNLDLIIIYAIIGEKISTNYPNIQEDSQTLIQIKDNLLVDFMLDRCFKYYRLDIIFPHSIKPKIQKTKCSESIIQEWQRHEEECKLRNENPLSVIFNNEPIDENVAFYGLYTSYQQRKSLQDYKTELTQKMGKLIPLQKSVEFQNSMIEMSFLRLTRLMDSTEFPDSLIMLYINHIKSLLFTFSMEYLISDRELVPLYKTVFEETFNNQYQSDLLLRIKDFTFKKDPSSILIDFSQKFFSDLKIKLIGSIPDDMNLNGKNKQEISSALKKKALRSTDPKSFSLEMIRKIEFALTINHFLNNPQKFEINSSYVNDTIDFSELKSTFDGLDDKGVFSYIGAVCYRLYSEYKTSSNLNIGVFLDSVPNILKMISQFFFKNEIGILNVHPSINASNKVNQIDSFVDCVFEYSLSSDKLTRYKNLINECKNEKINVLTFYIKAVEYVSVFINENKFNESFSSIHKIIQQIDELRSYLPILIKVESDS